MTNLFFYGTLMDAEVRRAVLGEDLAVVPATLAGWRRVGVAGRPYPTLVPHRTATVAGVVALAVDPRQLRLLSHYEGPEYGLRMVRIGLEAGSPLDAWVYICPPGRRAIGGTWHLSDWLRRHKSTCLSRIRLHGRAAPPSQRVVFAYPSWSILPTGTKRKVMGWSILSQHALRFMEAL